MNNFPSSVPQTMQLQSGENVAQLILSIRSIRPVNNNFRVSMFISWCIMPVFKSQTCGPLVSPIKPTLVRSGEKDAESLQISVIVDMGSILRCVVGDQRKGFL